MDLLKNYLGAVGKHLPEREREDILQELSANLTAELEDREAELGRPVTEDEVVSVIRAHGHPMVVAARYAPQRYLIGPSLFPIYWYVLGRALPIATLIYAIVSVSTIVTGAQRVAEAALRVPGVLFGVAAWVTLVFAVGEFGMRKFRWDFGKLCDWNPRDLPKAEQFRPEVRWKAICAFVVSLLLTGWIAAVPYFPFLLLGPGAGYLQALPIRPAPIWGMLYWPVVGFFLARCVLDFACAMRPRLRQQRAWAEVILHGVVVVGLIAILQSGDYFSLIPGRTDAAKYQELVAGLNQGVVVAAAVTLVIAIAQTVLAARNVVAATRGSRFAPPTVSL